jgi:peroxiredoxin
MKTTANWIARGTWIAVIIATIIYGCTRPSTKPIANGSPAPRFTFNDAYGKPVRLSDYRGRVLVLCFWSSSYSPCDDALSNMNTVAESFKGQDVAFVGVNIWGNRDEFQDYVTKHPRLNSIRLVYDPLPQGADITLRRYGVDGFPMLMLVNKEGVVIANSICWDQSSLTYAVNWGLGQK